MTAAQIERQLKKVYDQVPEDARTPRFLANVTAMVLFGGSYFIGPGDAS